jgi:uncharacterized protein
VITAPQLPYDEVFYEALSRDHRSFPVLSRSIVPANSGYGLAVGAGQTFRLEMIEGPQIIDLDLFSAADPSEHFSAPTQLWLEGGRVGRLDRVWGSPPASRPIATVIEDRIVFEDIGLGYRDHKCYGAHCNPHPWAHFAKYQPNTCYDNLWTGARMVGLGQRQIHDNLNLYMKAALDPLTGQHLTVKSDAVAGDYIQFFAEIDLLVVFSLCPYGDGSVVPEDWATTVVPRYPIAVEVADSGRSPLPWPYPEAAVSTVDKETQHADR